MGAPSYDPRVNAHRSGYTQAGFAARYDAYRPIPPPALLDLLCQFVQTPAPRLVVDLGSGTGLSTAVWAERAQRVIGIEPLEAMRRTAEARYEFPHVCFGTRPPSTPGSRTARPMSSPVRNRCTGWSPRAPLPRRPGSCGPVGFSPPMIMTCYPR